MASSDPGVVHVDLARLDKLLHLVGELVITRRSFVDQSRRARARHGFKEQVLELVEATERVGRISEEIQAKVLKARMLPIGSVFRRFHRLIADLSGTGDKDIELSLVGEKTEVDKRTSDELVEPLVHLVRNALDHGIESALERERCGKPRHGTITLVAAHEGNRLVVEVRDDGAGIPLPRVRQKAIERGLLTAGQAEEMDDNAVLNLLFLPGFSTATGLTALSGRGVGLDAAKRRVEMLGGRLAMTSVAGEGTRTRIELPLTTAIVEALIVGIGDEAYALPLEHVQEVIRVDRDDIGWVDGREVTALRGEALTLLHLSELVELPPAPGGTGRVPVVVIRYGERQFGVVVDRVLDRHDIVIKGMGHRLSGTRGIAGASIGGDRHVLLVLDAAILCEEAVAAAGRKRMEA